MFPLHRRVERFKALAAAVSAVGQSHPLRILGMTEGSPPMLDLMLDGSRRYVIIYYPSATVGVEYGMGILEQLYNGLSLTTQREHFYVNTFAGYYRQYQRADMIDLLDDTTIFALARAVKPHEDLFELAIPDTEPSPST